MERSTSKSSLPQVDKKQGDPKWRRVIRPSFLAIAVLVIIVMIFVCNVAVSDPNFAGSLRQAESNEVTPERTLPLSYDTTALPRGVVRSSTDYELRHLWLPPEKGKKMPQNLLAMPVGIKQKKNVDKIVAKFPAENFTVLLFHYDGKVDGWTDLKWSARAIHVMAANQTKWWFAKRFLHPDVVQKYNYIFLWDEDLGVEHFHAGRYLDIMEDEGFEISQPALSRNSSEVHHRLTIWKKKVRAHRRTYTYTARQSCNNESTGPPCTGWVEMMAPVFSRAAWRCTWLMIQNDLIHAWGLDYKLGYCAQGVRSEKVGIIDAEFVVHKGIPSLGGESKKISRGLVVSKHNNTVNEKRQLHAPKSEVDVRGEIRKKAGVELNVFARRWKRAAAEDPDWEDPYRVPETIEDTVAPGTQQSGSQETSRTPPEKKARSATQKTER